jgi:hypothetical protein
VSQRVGNYFFEEIGDPATESGDVQIIRFSTLTSLLQGFWHAIEYRTRKSAPSLPCGVIGKQEAKFIGSLQSCHQLQGVRGGLSMNRLKSLRARINQDMEDYHLHVFHFYEGMVLIVAEFLKFVRLPFSSITIIDSILIELEKLLVEFRGEYLRLLQFTEIE